MLCTVCFYPEHLIALRRQTVSFELSYRTGLLKMGICGVTED